VTQDTAVFRRVSGWLKDLFATPVGDGISFTCQRCGEDSSSVSMYFGRPVFVLCNECADDAEPPRFQDYYPPHEYWETAKNEE